MANRPLTLDDYVGQGKIKRQLYVTMGACAKNNTPLPHMLFYGNPGLGKTTLGKIIASQFGVRITEVMASNLNTVDDIENVLAALSEESFEILFIDEIHRLNLKMEELLYLVMEDFEFEREVSFEGKKQIERFWVPKFTLMGATTLAGDLSRPLRDRFSIHFQLQDYNLEELSLIISKLAQRERVEINPEAMEEISKRAKGVARIAISYFYRCKEYADFKDRDRIDTEVTDGQFEMMGIDEIGLDENDYRVLSFLASQSRPVGLGVLATGCDIDQPTLCNIIEPYLVQRQLVNRTRSGRELTEVGRMWLHRNNSMGLMGSAPLILPQVSEEKEFKVIDGKRKVGEIL